MTHSVQTKYYRGIMILITLNIIMIYFLILYFYFSCTNDESKWLNIFQTKEAWITSRNTPFLTKMCPIKSNTFSSESFSTRSVQSIVEYGGILSLKYFLVELDKSSTLN